MRPSTPHALRPARRPLSALAGAIVAAGMVAGALSAPTAAAAPAAPAARGQAGLSAAAPSDATIAARLAARVRAGALGRDTAVRVYDPATGRTVFATQSTEAQLPASNMKLVTAFDALSVIGPATRFPTRVVRGSGSRSVVLVGGGDPLLSSKDLRTLARRTVAGLAGAASSGRAPARVRLAVDDSLFPPPRRSRGWTSSYGLGEISPVRALARHGVASADTTVDAISYFADRLRAEGVAVTYEGRSVALPGAEQVARLAGRRVDAAVRQMLLVSDNQVAEVLFRQVALATGRPATWTGARKAARSTLRAAGIPVTGLALVDGSGLSRSNRLTAKALVAVTAAASAGTDDRLAALVPALPVAGRSGTLRYRFSTAPASCARGAVRAKTGFVNGVVGLTGVAVGADGRRRVFSVLANNIPSSRYSVADTQRAVDRLAATVAGCY